MVRKFLHIASGWIGRIIIVLLTVLIVGSFFLDYEAIGGTVIGKAIGTNTDLTNGLVMHLTFDGATTSTTFLDQSGNSHHGTTSGTVNVRPGKVGQGVEFDASTFSYVGVDDHADFAGTTFTVAGWVYIKQINGSDEQGIIAQNDQNGSPDDERRFGVRVTTAGLLSMEVFDTDCDIVGRTSADTPSAAPLNQWFHLVMEVQSDEATLYIDNASTTSMGLTTVCSDVNPSIRLGARQATTDEADESDVRVDDVRYYNRVLSEAERTRLYELGQTTKLNTTINKNDDLENGLIAHWTMDGVNTDSSTSSDAIKDRSSNANHGLRHYGEESTLLETGGCGACTSFSLDIRDADTERVVLVVASDESQGTDLTNVTVDGKSCEYIVQAENNTGLGNHTELWYCDESHLGSSADTVTVAIVGGDAGWGIHGYVLGGMSQGGPFDFGVDETSTADTVTVTGIDAPDNAFALMVAAHGGSSLTVSSWPSPLLEQLDGPDPTSAELYGASAFLPNGTTSASLVATFSASPATRNTAIAVTWPIAGLPLVPGKLGQAYKFDGVNDYVDFGDDAELDFGSNQDFTVALWVKADGARQASIYPMFIQKRISDGGSGNDWSIFRAATGEGPQWWGEIFVSGATNYLVGGSADIDDNSWQHIVLQRNGTTMHAYENGVLASSTTHANISASLSNSSSTLLGRGNLTSATVNAFDGALDDIRVYDRALSADEILRLYQLGATTKISKTPTPRDDFSTLTSDMVGYWSFDGKDIDLGVATAEVRASSTSNLHGDMDFNTGDINQVPGKFGQALFFDTENPKDHQGIHILDGADTGLLTSVAAASVSLWFKLGSFDPPTGDEVIFDINSQSGSSRFELTFDNDTEELKIGGRALNTDSFQDVYSIRDGSIERGRWYHAVGMIDYANADIFLYIDGAFENSSTSATFGASQTESGEATDVRIAQNSTLGLDFSGTIDEIRLYERLLTAEEIQYLYELAQD